ncbi:cation:proton antiporter [Actinopolymorpha singaporensis]|uniref:Potassium/proton antiporter membrane subunit, CPA2 family n=1 Tax=Actinopolymorpha singaporensis TaxID=117157 RepID=A0A1H1PM58_9ACTN|nr:cation:proton antiporter [Actinopolymorpha singaporensis]SDS12174.1 potassium/proton antiporter membrane subunit, CPA2 family [Actinopolymorpha singaporensis]
MHPALLLIELGAIVLGLGLLGRFAGRYGLSPIPLYLLAGLAFGHGGLLPLDASEEFVSVGAEIGVILLLLMLGLEYTAADLVTNLKTQFPAGIVDFTLNAVPGALAALLLGWGPVAAVVLAGVTWISSSGVIAKVLSDLGRVGNRETPVILSVLVLEDLSMAVYLPIITALLAGTGLVTGSITLVIALGAAAVVLLVALRYGRLISQFVSSDDPEKLLLVVFGLTLLVAGIAQQVQVSAAVGAFLVGIALSGEVAEGAHTLLSPLRDLFAAVFFVFFGLNTDPASIPPVLVPALLLAVVTVITKIATGYWAARRAGIGERGRLRAGGALVARGEFSIVIAGIGVTAGLQPQLGPLATAYVLLLVIAGPLTARYAEPVVGRLRRTFNAPLSSPSSPSSPTAPPPAGSPVDGRSAEGQPLEVGPADADEEAPRRGAR